jgi:hypothetical protein
MNAVMSWASNHQQFLAGLVCGWAATHPRVIVKAGFRAAMRVPGAEEFVKKNGPAIHALDRRGRGTNS